MPSTRPSPERTPSLAVLLYRVFLYVRGAPRGAQGHPDYLHPQQGKGRIDNPTEYRAWYLSGEASGAIGETFADLKLWTATMFDSPAIPGARRALGIYSLDDATPILNLDDARSLLDRSLRPTQIVERNLPVTQGWALSIFREETAGGDRRWDGVRWWSARRPQWRIYGIWSDAPHCVNVEDLDLAHHAVVDAATALAKPLP
jgi:RES domain